VCSLLWVTCCWRSELTLFDGTRLVRHDRYQTLLETYTEKVLYEVHTTADTPSVLFCSRSAINCLPASFTVIGIERDAPHLPDSVVVPHHCTGASAGDQRVRLTSSVLASVRFLSCNLHASCCCCCLRFFFAAPAVARSDDPRATGWSRRQCRDSGMSEGIDAVVACLAARVLLRLARAVVAFCFAAFT